MNLFVGDKLLDVLPDRPLALNSIVRYHGVNYTVLKLHGLAVVLEKRDTSGQADTPDYDLDTIPLFSGDHRFRVCKNLILLGRIMLNHMPAIGEVVGVKDQQYRILDWSIGKRRYKDTLYVTEA